MRRRSPRPRSALLQKYYRVGRFGADDRRRLFAFARDLLNSDYAGHRLTFQLFAQSPAFAHLLAVYSNYDFSGPADSRQTLRRSRGTRSEAAHERRANHRRRHVRVRPFNTRDTYPEQQLEATSARR